MKVTALKGHQIVSGCNKGLASVSIKSISLLGGVNPNSRLIIERNHDLKGKNILCLKED